MKSEAPQSHLVVRFDDTAISCAHPSGRTERISWEELDEVSIRTTDAGLSFAEVSWVLTGNSPGSSCVIPHGSEGEDVLRERLQQLPGFDTEAFAAAMSSISDGQFVCWNRPV